MWSPSELHDGFEPHDHICSAVPAAPTSAVYMLDGRVGRGVPGVGAVGGYQGGCYTGYKAGLQIEAYLRNIID